ncbi:MAG: Stp1/IreP family PP2C-type Ser/Thr phosphatase [Acidimicrobiales bacterium]
MTVLQSGSATDVGRVRRSNQDVALEETDLFAVADGMGGHVGGDVAASVAVDTLRRSFRGQPTVEGLRRAVAEANAAVWRRGQDQSGLRGMGTTLTATAVVAADDGRQVIALANVGDSRAYVFTRGRAIQVTADHSLAEEKVRQGELTEAEAAIHPHRHILTRALGVSSDVDVDLWELHLGEGDRILLCSDGLTNEVTDERIGEALRSVPDPTDAARTLVDAAVAHGGNDNVTVVVVDVLSVGEEPTGVAATGVREPEDAPAGDQDGPAGDQDGPAGDQDGPAGDQDAAGGTTDRLVSLAGSRPPRSDRRLPRRPGDGGDAGPGASPPDEGSRAGETTVGDERIAASGGQRMGRTATATDTATATATTTAPPVRVDEPNGVPAGHEAAAAARECRGYPRPARAPRPAPAPGHRRRDPAAGSRWLTVRAVIFVLLVLAVLAAAYALVRWYATANWYVTVDHGHLAVYQGRPGGFLWYPPVLVDRTAVTTSEVVPTRLHALAADVEEPTLAAARRYVRNLHQEWLSLHPSAGATATATSGAAGGSSGARSPLSGIGVR